MDELSAPASGSGTKPAKRRKTEKQGKKDDFDTIYEEASLKAAKEMLKDVNALRKAGRFKKIVNEKVKFFRDRLYGNVKS